MKNKDTVRVVIFSSWFYPIVGGAERQSQQLAESLIALGIDVRVITRHYPNLKRCENINNVAIYRLPCLSKFKFLEKITFFLSSLFYLIRHRNEYDIIHTYILDSQAIVTAIIGFIFGKVTLIKIGNGGYCGDMARCQSLFGKMKLRFVVRCVDAFVVTSMNIKDELLQNSIPQEKIHLIPTAVNTDKFCPVDKKVQKELRGNRTIPDVFVAIFLGRLVPQKGVDTLLAAWEKAFKGSTRAVLVVAGDGSERVKLEELVHSLGISETVLFKGMVSNVEHYLQSADVYISSSRAEGLSNSFLEAMASGLAIIATDTGGASDLINDGENGFVFAINDRDALSEYLVRLEKERELVRSLGNAAYLSVKEKYSFSCVVEENINLYNSLLPGK